MAHDTCVQISKKRETIDANLLKNVSLGRKNSQLLKYIFINSFLFVRKNILCSQSLLCTFIACLNLSFIVNYFVVYYVLLQKLKDFEQVL